MDWEEWLEHMPCSSPFLVFSLSDRLHSIDYDLKVSLLRKSIGAWNIFFSSNHSAHAAVSQSTVCAPLDKTAETQVWGPVPGDDRREIRSKKRKFLPFFHTNSQWSSPTDPLESQSGGIRVGAPTRGPQSGGCAGRLLTTAASVLFPRAGVLSCTVCSRIPLRFPFWSRWFWRGEQCQSWWCHSVLFFLVMQNRF